MFSRTSFVVKAAACSLSLCLVACGSPASSPEQSTSQNSDAAQSNVAPAPNESAQNSSSSTAQSSEGAGGQQSTTGDAALAARLNEDIAQVGEAAGMDVRVAVIDLATGTKAGYKSDERMVSASMIKMMIADTVLQKSADGAFTLDDALTMRESDIVGGSGSISSRGAGAQLSYRELIGYMISESDNTAANMLIDAVGMQAVNEQAHKLGFTATELGRKMMDTEAQARGEENYVSADELATLFKMVYEGNMVNQEGSALVLQALEAQEDTNGIIGGLPKGTVFAHKTGSLDTVAHDGGIVEGEHPYILVVLCGGNGFSYAGAYEVMAKMAGVTYADITGGATA